LAVSIKKWKEYQEYQGSFLFEPLEPMAAIFYVP